MTFVSTIGQSLDQVERIKLTQLQLNTLSTQLATGRKTDLFEGLGTDVIPSKRARANFQKIDTYISNIDTADRRVKLMFNTLTEIKNQAEDVLSAIELQTQQGEYEIESVSDLARNTANFIRDLVNLQDGDRYLFGGAETQDAPLKDNGTLETYLLAQLTDWADPATPADQIDTDTLIDNYQNSGILNDSIIGYSATLTSGNVRSVTVRVEQNAEIDYSVYANTDAIRDIIVGVNMIGQIDQVIDEVTLDPDDPATTITAPGVTKQDKNNNFYQFFNDLGAMLSRALDGIDTELYQLSQSQAQLAQIREDHVVDKNTLQQTIDDVENVDLNEVAVKLNSLQIQLDASYRVTATISRLNLANFL